MYSPTKIEQHGVFDVYDNIADNFSDTRRTVWTGVQSYLQSIPIGSTGLELGCGNGKNMVYAQELGLNINGIDTCFKFIKSCRKLGLHVTKGNAIIQQYPDYQYDFIISIAVFHHISTELGRNTALLNMINMLKNGGSGLITVWAVEQDRESKKKFIAGDNTVIWNKPEDIDGKRTYIQYERFYYVYTKEMMEKYMNQYDSYIRIDNLYNEKGNWFCEFTKIK